MSYFVTFYSYKGGVGRTLALANVAWLLANHPTEPARVLVLDFDLGAPGLFQVFKMAKAKTSPGIVDYIVSYLDKASIPQVKSYIHKTAYDGIDILPAGRMDSRYQRRFEAIDWKTLYEGAFGHQLIERLKADISNISPAYDYVLVDSLTGYSDVGGVCVKQLSDALVLLFRLNQQNLNGIGSVYRSTIRAGALNKIKPVLPVVTPSWPFLDEAATEWIARAQATFPTEQLLEISFDSSLSFGEKIISVSASKLPLTSKILADYRNLASQIREQNPQDALTIWGSICHNQRSLFADSAELYLTLLRRRPNNFMYWRNLATVFGPYVLQRGGTHPLPSSVQALVAFTKQEAEKGNKYALFGLSLILPFTTSEPKESLGKHELDRAIQIDPNFFVARIQRANLALSRKKYEDAISDFKACLDLPTSDAEVPHDRLYAMIANAYLRLFDADTALSYIDSAISARPSDIAQYSIRARALYLKGEYPNALADAQRFASQYPSNEPGLLLPSLILAAMERMDEARHELDRVGKAISTVDIWNLAEAYLAIDPAKTISLLGHKRLQQNRPALSRVIILIARIFLGENLNAVISDLSKAKTEGVLSIHDTWNFYEIVAMTRAKTRAGKLSKEALAVIYELFRSSVDQAAATTATTL